MTMKMMMMMTNATTIIIIIKMTTTISITTDGGKEHQSNQCRQKINFYHVFTASIRTTNPESLVENTYINP